MLWNSKGKIYLNITTQYYDFLFAFFGYLGF